MKRFDFLFEALVNGGIGEERYKKIVPEIVESNRQASLMACCFGLIVTSLLYMVATLGELLSRYQMIYLVSGGAMLVLMVCLILLKNQSHFVICTCMYILITIIFGTGTVLGTFASPNEVSAAYIALLVIVPQVFTERPFRLLLPIWISVFIYIVLVIRLKSVDVWVSDITNALIFGLISMGTSVWFMILKLRRCSLEYTVREMAEKDQLTGTKNRNQFEKDLQRPWPPYAGAFYIVYMDVNGLHEINNTQGHAAGDQMLQYTADGFKGIFGEDTVYRIGGDEFVSMGLDRSEEELTALMAKLTDYIRKGGYNAAVGMIRTEDTEKTPAELLKEAEARMYEDKKQFYSSAGHDRRSR